MRFYSTKPHVNMQRAAYSEPAIDRMTAMKNMMKFSLIATIKLMMPITICPEPQAATNLNRQ